MKLNYDLYRLTGDHNRKKIFKILLKDNGFRFLFFWRKIKNKSTLSFIYKFFLRHEARKSGLEIPLSVELGEGAMLLHAYGITINSRAKIGKNLVILKGATIGNTKRGPKAGAPIIGDNVYIGLNSTIVGGIKIGEDVLIAPNSYVNFDVPSHSIVIGNPGIIRPKGYATEGYINNCIEIDL